MKTGTTPGTTPGIEPVTEPGTKPTSESSGRTARPGAAARPDVAAPVSGFVVQLRLLPGGTAQPDWVLDERTRRVGRQGVAQAREILRRVAPPEGGRATAPAGARRAS